MATLSKNPVPIMWGEGGEPPGTQATFLRLLSEAIGLGEETRREYPDPKDVEIPPSGLQESQVNELASIVGSSNVQANHGARVCHAVGMGYQDIIRYCHGRLDSAPDAVVSPTSADQIEAIIQWCTRNSIGLVPHGGGTNVVSALSPPGQYITLSMRNLNRVLAFDESSATITVQPGIRGPELESFLNPRGFTLGHFPSSFQYSTIGGWLATRSVGYHDSYYGKLQDRLISLRVLTPTGAIRVVGAPSGASGPDLNRVFLGSEGALGVIVEATLHLHSAPEAREYVSGIFRSFDRGVEVVKELLQEALMPASIRLFDQDETRVIQAMSMDEEDETSVARRARRWFRDLGLRAKGVKPGRVCLMILGFEGQEAYVHRQAQHATRVIAIHEGDPLGPEPGEKWHETRYQLPYIRDALIERGALVDSIDVTTTWDYASGLRKDVIDAIRSTLESETPNCLVFSHISQGHPSGTTLNFMFLAPARKDGELEQWQSVRKAALNAILKYPTSVSHQFGVGRVDIEHFQRQVGETYMNLLRALKWFIDPNGIMNPGVLGL